MQTDKQTKPQSAIIKFLAEAIVEQILFEAMNEVKPK